MHAPALAPMIEKATPSDSSILTEITKKSKAYWGYSPEQIESWAAQLTVSEEYLQNYTAYNLVLENKIIGYYAFKQVDASTIKLDNLFLLPDHIGKGNGRLLMEDFLKRVRDPKIDKLVLHSEPFAEAFYTKFGFTVVGQMETSIPGRFLPIMEKSVG
jgi:N-acetylglutamate synthase-like GNAT family acetyltransferase